MKINNGCSVNMNTRYNYRMPKNLDEDIDRLIANTPVLPGANAATANTHRRDMAICKNTLTSLGVWSQQQNDAKNRNIAVGMQATVETAFMNNLIQDPKARLSVIVHTNNPPTPLCSEHVSDSLFHSDIRGDRAVESTVTSRKATNEYFLSNHQVSYCSLYGTVRDSCTDQDFFNKKVVSNTNMFAFHAHENPAVALSGATYIYTDGKNEKVIMGVRITQANEASKMCSLFVGRHCHDGHIGKFLTPLNDYIKSIQNNLPEDNSVDGRRKYFELKAIQNIIS